MPCHQTVATQRVTRDFFSDTAKYAVAAFCGSGLYLASLPIISRLASPAEFGRYLLAVATVGVLTSLSVGWITPGIMRFWPRYVDQHVETFNATWLRLGLRSTAAISVLLFAVLAATTWFDRVEAGFLALVFATESILLLLASLLKAARRLNWYLGITCWTNAARLALGVLLVVTTNQKTSALLAGWLIANAVAVGTLLRWRSTLAVGPLGGAPSSREIARELAQYGLPALGMVLLVMVLSVSDQYVLAIFRGPEDVALYAAAYALSERSLFQIVSIITMAGGPLMFHTWEQQGADHSRALLEDLSAYFLLLGVPATVGLWVLARPVVQAFLPPAYAEAYRVVGPVAVGGLFWGVMHSYMYALGLFKRSDLQAMCLLPAASLNVILNVMLVPRFGVIASAWVTAACYAVALITTFVVSRRFLRWRFPMRSFVIVGSASLAMAGVASGIASVVASPPIVTLVAAMTAGAATYVVILVALNAVPRLSLRGAIAAHRASLS